MKNKERKTRYPNNGPSFALQAELHNGQITFAEYLRRSKKKGGK